MKLDGNWAPSRRPCCVFQSRAMRWKMFDLILNNPRCLNQPLTPIVLSETSLRKQKFSPQWSFVTHFHLTTADRCLVTRLGSSIVWSPPFYMSRLSLSSYPFEFASLPDEAQFDDGSEMINHKSGHMLVTRRPQSKLFPWSRLFSALESS